jgi:hypothetical protein
MRRVIGLTLCAGLIAVLVGCQHPCARRPLCCGDRQATQPAFVPVPGQPIGQPPIQPAGAFPIAPAGALGNPGPGAGAFPIAPPDPNPNPGTVPGQLGAPPSISNAPPTRGETPWQPGDSPEPAQRPESNRDAKPRIQLYAPERLEKDDPQPTPEPPVRKPGVQATLPPIPQFASAKDNVYAGLRPPLDGLDWLQENRIMTVVQIRPEGDDDSADQKQVEKRNIRYVGFEVTPQTLTKEKADEFIKLIRAGSKQGIFVYDSDGALAGAMWYLYFRWGEYLDDDASQLRARQLGLQLDRDGQHRDMWLAVQKLLSENNR